MLLRITLMPLLLQDMPDKTGLALGGIGIGIGVKTNRFTIRFGDGSSKPIELSADDAQTKSEWLEGIGSKWHYGLQFENMYNHVVILTMPRTIFMLLSS